MVDTNSSPRYVPMNQSSSAVPISQSFQEAHDSLNLLKLVVLGEKDYQEGNFRSDKDFRMKMKAKLDGLQTNGYWLGQITDPA